jgi:oxygen-independent coproporphyrinogen-3 oxidase
MSAYSHVYAHFPFCDVICHYCDFYTARSKDADQVGFLAAITKEARSFLQTEKPKLQALYLGGGTPSVSPLGELRDFINSFQPYLEIDAEITLETNPNTIADERLAAWQEMGINRISLGVQSLTDTTLRRLGRTHTAAEAIACLTQIYRLFPNTSADLIYAVPGTNKESLLEDARRFVDLGIPHLSAYHLTLESKHFLFSKLPNDEFASEQVEQLSDFLQSQGYEHYEMSNFGKPGFRSKNNSNYWRGGAYFALGPSAHGFDGGQLRWKNISDWKEYINRINLGQSVVETRETLSSEQLQIERLFTALRTLEGLDLTQWENSFGFSLAQQKSAVIERLVKEGLAALSNGHFVLTLRGRLVADEIVKKLL